MKYYCAIVKRVSLTGSVATNRSIREVHYQAQQALSEPFISPFDGSKAYIEKAYFITPYDIDPSCANSIKAELQQSNNRIYFIDGPTLLSYLKQHLPTLLSSLPDPRMRYLAALARRIAQIRSLDHLGPGKKLTLTEIYTGGHLSKVTPEKARFISFSKPEVPAERISLPTAFGSHKQILIVADVGAGKTTLLQRFALESVQQHAEQTSLSEHAFPLFVSLYTVAAETLTSYDDFVLGLQEYIIREEGFAEFDIEQANKYMILLDGFDELPAHHATVAKYLDQLSHHFTGGIILTTRPSRIPQLTAPFAMYRLNPFSDVDIDAFLAKWFPDNTHVRLQMAERIRTDEALGKFCRSPLMLTLYAILASKYSIDRLPKRRTDIYESITKMLLDEWDRSRGIQSDFSYEAKQYVLEQVAYNAHTRRRKQFDLKAVETIISDFFGAQGIQGEPMAMFREILFRSSLIKPNTAGAYEFVHLSFQEYFCAKYLIRSGDLALIDRTLFDEWWKNVYIFYFGIRRTLDGTRLQLKRRVKGSGFKLVEYLAEADYTSEPTRERIYGIMANDLLYTSELTQSEIGVCATFSSDVLKRLDPVIIGALRPPDASGRNINVSLHVFNFVRLILLADRTDLNQLLQNRPQHLERLSAEDLISLLESLVLRLGEPDWLIYFRLVARVCRGRLGEKSVQRDEIRTRLSKL